MPQCLHEWCQVEFQRVSGGCRSNLLQQCQGWTCFGKQFCGEATNLKSGACPTGRGIYSIFLMTPPPLDCNVLSISDAFDGFVTPMRIRPSDTSGSYRSGFFQLGMFAVMSSVITVVTIALKIGRA